MIGLAQTPEPPILLENCAAWTEEYVTWASERIGSEPRKYAHPEVRAALEAETASKCAYCESLIKDVTFSHIEHKLPKSVYPDLVCCWENLTIGCPQCNTKKGAYDDPECPLLDPYVDEVETAIAFGGPMAIPRGGARARMTLLQLELNRMDLLHSRARILQTLDLLLETIERTTDPAILKVLWAEIDAFTSATSEYASACRYFVELQTQERGLIRPD